MEQEIYNPLHLNNLLDTKNIKLEINLINKIINWECPICYENIDRVSVCFPYQCCHINCFECLTKHCGILKKQNKCPTEILKCPLCRSKVHTNWIQSNKVYKKKIIHEGKTINLNEVY